VSRRVSAVACCAAAVALLAAGAGCSVENLDLGKMLGSGAKVVQAVRAFDWEEEKEIGGTVATRIAGTFQVDGDPRAREYVNMIAATVASRSERSDLVPRVLIIREDVPNAFACPGGYMFVTTGLLRVCRDESELAGILGHEFAHVARKHTLPSLRWKRAFSVGAAEAAKYGKEELQQAYQGFKPAVDKAINGVVNNRHGTGAESEADALGAEWAALAGYDPAGLGRLIGRLPVGEKGRWLEAFSVYKNGDTRAQRILKVLADRRVPVSGGVRNAERYRRELAGVIGS